MVFKEQDIPFYKDVIVFNRGVYQWNNNIPCIIDVEEFEKHCKRAFDTKLPEDERLAEYRAAIDYYTGDFLPGSSEELWIIPISSYLRTLVFKCIYAKLEILERRDSIEGYDRIILLCKRMLIREPLEESIHYYLIKALYKNGNQKEAILHYQKVSEQFYKEFGMGPSDELKELYDEINKLVQNIEPDIKTIRDDLKEENNIQGAFYCEYEIFKNLYRLEARTAARMGNSMFVALITVDSLEREDKQTQNNIMQTLQDSVQRNLRKGDVYSRFSSTQFVLLLPTVTYENCELVMNRVLGSYENACRGKAIKARAKILPLEPIE